ncbi:MAG TPA: alanine racemase [Bacteroidota bacterium]|nr:alanine racemase [Bacteroidota bacterium]
MRLTRAEIDLNALASNVRAIRSHLPGGMKIMGLVKANAYGHGLVAVAQALVRFGIDYLGVGFLEEGVVLREHGITSPILVLGGVLGHQVKDFFEHDLEITVSSIELARRIEEESRETFHTRVRVHLKIDTGMERLGVHSERALPFIEEVAKLQHVEIVGIYSHFATADEKDKSFAHEQLRRFCSLIDQIRERGIDPPLVHIANSGAVVDLPESYCTMVRPGIMLYGYYPSKETSESILLKHVLSLKSRVVFLKEVDAGTSISYGRLYTTKTRTKIATVPVGYGDGYNRKLTNRGEVLIRGRRYPVVGAVCMDQIMIDVGLEADIHVGDDVVLLGSDHGESISAWDIADKVGTIPYEIFTGITARVPRIFIQ